MQNSLPVRPSLEQLKKLAKDLVKNHAEKQPEALALICDHLPALSGKTEDEIAAYPFALHDAQSVVARQYGFASWEELRRQVEKSDQTKKTAEPAVEAKLRTICDAYERRDYALYCSVLSEDMKAAVTEKRFKEINEHEVGNYFRAAYQTDYMGSMLRRSREVHFWRLWIKGWENDLLVRISFNHEGLIAGLLFSDPYNTKLVAK